MTHRADCRPDAAAIEIAIDRRAGAWPDDAAAEARRAALAVFAGEPESRAGELSIVLADDAFVRRLNLKYRGKDRSTNVLSFPADPPLLGDVVLACETLDSEARTYGRPFRHHLVHLVVHGTLHLLGYDHDSPEDQNRMEHRETDVLNSLGVPDPYVSNDEPN